MQGMVIARVSSCRWCGLSGIGSWRVDITSCRVEAWHRQWNVMAKSVCVIQCGSGSSSTMLSVSGDLTTYSLQQCQYRTVLGAIVGLKTMIYHWLTSMCTCSTLRVCSFSEMIHVNLMLHRKHFKLYFLSALQLMYANLFYLPSVSALTSCRVPVVMYMSVMWFTVGDCDLMVISF